MSFQRIFTDAPEAYDGFGTWTVRKVGTARDNRQVRQVQIEADHFDWQTSRYASGMYFSASLSELMRLELIDAVTLDHEAMRGPELPRKGRCACCGDPSELDANGECGPCSRGES